MRPTVHTFGLSRQSTGLTEAHRDLIKLLAAVAVQEYLAESESADMDAPDQQEISQ